jgi:phage terminase small subunit|nr:MAG TPA: Terminase small subunit [Caudoviricetes sp.]
MTDKQRKFCDEYLIDLNATRAYKLAYPNVKSESAATSGASRLLRNVKVKTYIDEQLEKISSEKIATAEEVMEYLTTVLRGESQSEIVVVEGVGDGCSVARTMQKKPDEKEKLKAAELLGKRYGLFTDKLEVDGVARVVINGEDDLDE